MGHINKAETFQLSAGSVKIVGEFSEKLKNNKKLAAIGTTPLALVLSACGGDSSSTTTSSNLLTLTKSADTYSASAVTGFTVTDSSTAKFDVADATANSYEIKLDATGTGVLEFDFVDAGDTVTLAAGSKTSGFTTLKVTDGTLDATSADLSGITRVEVASGLKISLAQIKEIPTLVANSATSEITVELASAAEATELVALISAGTVKVFGDVNPIKLVAAPTATIATETLTAKQTETTASVKPATEAPADTASTVTETEDTSTDTDTDTDTTTTTGGGGGTSTIDFGLIKSGAGTYIVGTKNGDVTVSVSGDLATFTPTSGVAVTNIAADVTGLRVDDITLTASAAIASGKTITGNGNMTVTALDATAAADLSAITASGTKTANVANDVTFTGDLGTFAVTVDTGKTLTTTAAKATGLAMTGAGGVSITALDADADADLSSITASGTLTANVADDVTFTGDLGTFGVTVDSGKTLTTTSAKVTGLTITGGSVTISDDITANTNITNITSTVDLSQADVAISASKTLTLTAAQAAAETFSGAGTLAVSASTTDDSFTAGTATLSIATGTGDDVLTAGVAANITAADEIDLGGGTADAIVISADGDTTGAVFDEAGYVGAETITVNAHASTASTNAKVSLNHANAFDQNTTIDASNMVDSGADFTLAISAPTKVDGDLLVKASGGANVLAGGDGADIFEFGAITTFTAADSVSGGAGSDQIKVTADNSSTGGIFDVASHVGVEQITVLANSTATHDAKVTLNYASAYTGALAIDASALTSSSAVFTLALAGVTANVDNALTVTGGAGGDTIATGDGADIITGGDGADVITGGLGANTVIVDADDSASVADAVAGDATGSDHFNDWASGDIIQITGELANGFNVTTDVLVGTGTEGTDVATDDVDDFLTTTYLVARDGDITDGFDTAMIVTSDGTAAAFADAAAAQAATSFNVTLAAGATVVLGAKNDTVVGSSTADVITGGAGVDTLNGGAGDDTFIVGTSHDGTAESYTGGDGTGDKLDVNAAADFSNDTLATIEILDLDASGTAVAITMNDAQVDMLSTITSAASAIGTGDKITLGDVMTSDMLDGTVIGGANDDEIIFILKDVALNALTLVDATMGAGDKLYIDGSNLTGTNAFTFDGSAEDDAAVLTITGGAAADTITGGDGADVINGGAGADKLSGDAGADTFHIVDGDSGAWNIDSGNAKLASTVNFDIILDAAAGDVIDLTDAVQSEAAYGTFTTATAGANLTATTTTDTIAQFIGTYDASANTFLSDTSGDDIMLAFKGTDAGDTTVDEAIIIVGQTNVYEDSELVAGVLTIA